MKSFNTLSLLFITIASAVVISSCSKKNDNGPSPTENKTLEYDDFSKTVKAWGTGENSYSNRTVTGGRYNVYNKSDSDFYFSYTDPLFSGLSDNFAIEAKVSASGGNSSWPAFGGLNFNFVDDSYQVAVFGYYNDGSFEIFGYDEDDNFTEYKDITTSTAIKKNTDNVLRIEQRSGKLRFLINGTEVFVMDKGDLNLDIAGFYADPKTTTSVDYFKAETL